MVSSTIVLFPLLLHISLSTTSTDAVDFLFNSFPSSSNLTLVGDAAVDPSSGAVKLTNDTNRFSLGRAFYHLPIKTRPDSTLLSSFSTSFVFSILPQISSSPGFGLAFVLSNSTTISGALSGQYFGLFTNATNPPPAPLVAVEFDTGQNPELNDPDGNHIGIDLNNIESIVTQTAGYYNSSGELVSVDMRNGQNIVAWIEFDGTQMEINVTIAPVGVSKPNKPLLSFKNPVIANYVSTEMFVGFSASKTTWVEEQRILAWSLNDNGTAREISTTGLPVFLPQSSSSNGLSKGAISGITIACVVVVFGLVLLGGLWVRKGRVGRFDNEDEVEDWELEFWPHRISYEELEEATNGFSKENLLGSGGFGRVYKGTLPNKLEVAVKCVSHDSRQGTREFMAEISSIGRVQHKSLVQMRGWCKKGCELILIYDNMPNGSLNRWIFDNPEKVLGWTGRRKVLRDVAEGLSYLHHGWDHVVLHRDVKSSNILLDSDMHARLGDFGLAKLYEQGRVPNTTRVVGTLGYMAPEVATQAVPTTASDVYSFGVVVLEVCCGRRPVETALEEERVVLIEWVTGKYVEGSLLDVVDERIKGEYRVEEMERFLKIGLVCCHPDSRFRPGMKDVVEALGGEEEVTARQPPVVFLTEVVADNSGSVQLG